MRAAIHHQQPDRVPLDLGSSSVTGVHASACARLRRLYGLPEKPVKVVDPFQMLAEVDHDLREALGVDTVGIQLPYTVFGFKNEHFKPWRLPDGTEVLVPGGFETRTAPNGDLLLFPRGDRSAPPSGRMPLDGYYFDPIVRQKPLTEENLDPRLWVEQTFARYTDEELRELERASLNARRETDLAVVGNFCDGGLGDIGLVPAPGAPDPAGVRDPQEWYISLLTRKSYVQDIFEYQTELALENLGGYLQACGERIDVIDVSETDFGGQQGPLVSPELFRELWAPRLKRINDWIHRNTSWKIFFHSCGAVAELLEDFIEAGVDIINPVQYTARGMDPGALKRRFGNRLVFWGGGVDSQRVLPFGTEREVEREVAGNLHLLGAGGGYVFAVVHNLQATVPDANIRALFDAFHGNRAVWHDQEVR
ncbi:MAG: uroporphyrinogen decarboxylase family protein [Spirochaetota bacterium]